jgi:hypothetical protein
LAVGLAVVGLAATVVRPAEAAPIRAKWDETIDRSNCQEPYTACTATSTGDLRGTMGVEAALEPATVPGMGSAAARRELSSRVAIPSSATSAEVSLTVRVKGAEARVDAPAVGTVAGVVIGATAFPEACPPWPFGCTGGHSRILVAEGPEGTVSDKTYAITVTVGGLAGAGRLIVNPFLEASVGPTRTTAPDLFDCNGPPAPSFWERLACGQSVDLLPAASAGEARGMAIVEAASVKFFS